MIALKQYNVFKLKKNINPSIVKGMRGVILEVLDSDKFEVEFVKDDGTNYEHEGQLTFTVDRSYLDSLDNKIDFYPQLGNTISNDLKSAMHDLGFTQWIHLRKERRDGKMRLVWTRPVEGFNEWFMVLLVLENDQLKIDSLKSPLKHNIDKTDIEGLVAFINKYIRKLD